MTTKEQRLAFIREIAPIMVKYARGRGYKCVSAAIAQACLESSFGTCALSKYHNYFGLKAGRGWKGGVVNMRTMEEYKTGQLTAIVDGFRVYPDMEQGVKGYYDFLSYVRYRAVKDQDNPRTYLKEIKAAGYASSSTYIQNNMTVVNTYNLESWDKVLSGQTQVAATIEASAPAIPPEYVIGGKYVLNVELNVRTDAGIWSKKLKHEDLTEYAQYHDRDQDGALDAGTVITCQGVQIDGSDIWIRIPSGWVAAYYKGNMYIKAAGRS